ncbi:MAG TPA: TAXI family TRAP transporter solute-binding subunit [Syntrophorhabdaceae bacterium]|nr:TAXI family TRAP transporter solute-binding subunit [Syntrophorhabdaceae bacterium]
MKKHGGNGIAIGIILMMAAFCFSFATSAYTADKVLMLNFGATQSSSSYYPPKLVMAKLINKYVPEVRVTTVESGSSYDNAMRVQEGVFQIGSGAVDAARDQYWGEGKWKGKPWKNVRLFMGLSQGALMTYVRKDAKIGSWSDLNDKPLNPGFIGSDAENLCMEILQGVPEVKPKIVRGTLEDTMRNLQLGKVIGVLKQSPTKMYDAAMASVNLELPLDIIGLNDSQRDKMKKAFPNTLFMNVKKGQFKEAPQSGNFWVITSFNGEWLTSDIPEDIVYKMTKAIYEHYDEVVQALAAAGWVDPLKMLTESASQAGPTAFAPLHAGVVRYCKEKGIQVPPSLIPPEYKGK